MSGSRANLPASPATASRRSLKHFDDFVLDPNRGTLSRGDEPLKLRPRTFQLLSYFIAHPQRLCSKNELIEAVWGPVEVTDDALTQCVVELRRVLGDDERIVLKTVPRRGYMLDVAVREERAQPLAAATATESTAGTRWWQASLPLAAVAILVFAALMYLLTPQRPPPTAISPPPAERNALAVMPFVDLSAAQDLQYLGDGIAEEVLNSLARASSLRVVGRTSSFALRDSGLTAGGLGERLDASHILEGSVREVDGRLRVTAQLVEAASERQLWSEVFSEDDGGELSLHRRVVDAVRTSFAEPAMQRPNARVWDPALYRQFLQAKFVLDSGNQDSLEVAEALLAQILTRDETFAPAWRELYRVGYAKSRRDPPGTRQGRLEVNMELRRLLDKAAVHDPGDPAVVAYQAWQTATALADLETAAVQLRRALDLAGDQESVLFVASYFAAAFLSDRSALAVSERVLEINPLCGLCLHLDARLHLRTGSYDHAVARIDQLRSITGMPHGQSTIALAHLLADDARSALVYIERESSAPHRARGLALALHRLGEESRWRLEVNKLTGLIESGGSPSELRPLLAEVYAQAGLVDAAFEELSILIDWALEGGVAGLPNTDFFELALAMRSPLLAPLKEEPRWEELLTRAGLAPARLAELELSLPVR